MERRNWTSAHQQISNYIFEFSKASRLTILFLNKVKRGATFLFLTVFFYIYFFYLSPTNVSDYSVTAYANLSRLKHLTEKDGSNSDGRRKNEREKEKKKKVYNRKTQNWDCTYISNLEGAFVGGGSSKRQALEGVSVHGASRHHQVSARQHQRPCGRQQAFRRYPVCGRHQSARQREGVSLK